MRIDNKLLQYLNGLARRKFFGNEYLWRRLNVFTHHDLVHEFLVSKYYDDQEDDKLNYWTFRHRYIIDRIRKAKSLDRRSREYTFTDAFLPFNPAAESHSSPDDEILTEEDQMSAAIEKSNPVYVDSFSWLGTYWNPLTGEPNSDAMAWDMKREMLRRDRYWMAANDYVYYRLLEKEKRETGTIKYADWKLLDPYMWAFWNIVFYQYPQKAKEAYNAYLNHDKKITQAEIAKILGIQQPTISRYRKHPVTLILQRVQKKILERHV